VLVDVRLDGHDERLDVVEHATPESVLRQVAEEAFRHQWREELKTVRDLGTFRDQRRNLAAEGRIDVVEVAAMTASGFRVARTAPVMGRVLIDDDERPGASPVVVIGFEEWQRRFGGDPRILERTLRLDYVKRDRVAPPPVW